MKAPSMRMRRVVRLHSARGTARSFWPRDILARFSRRRGEENPDMAARGGSGSTV